ncbi:hypothetical protein HK405_005807 [Cladochytrium tenue]|nr:hypothetical protein HK405_005807 [Cladochytrium tenue]
MATIPTATARPDDNDPDAPIRAVLHGGGSIPSDDDIRALFLLFGQAAIPAAHIAETPGAIVDLRCSCCSRNACKVKDSRFPSPLLVIPEASFCPCPEANTKPCCRHLIACMLRSALAPKGAVRTAVELDGEAFHSAIEACLVGG